MTEYTAKTGHTAEELIQRLRKSDAIPALDENVQELCEMTQKSDTRTTELTSVIMRDPALTSRLLTMANSVAFRPRMPINTVSTAVVMFGFERIQQLALGLSLFKKCTPNVRDKELYRLQVCAYCTGALTMHLARLTGAKVPEASFVSGLLHQVPRLVLASEYPVEYRQMEQLINEDKMEVDDACIKVFGVKFGALSEALADVWKLQDHLRSNSQGSLGRIVALAVKVADMLFGNCPAGPAAMASVANAIAAVLKKKEIDITDFIGESFRHDPNMHDFFQLSERDMVMMARIAEWGKVNSSTVAESLTAGFEAGSKWDVPQEDPLATTQFLSELTLAVHQNYDLNDVLTMAMEGLYRCLRLKLVVVALVDNSTQRLRGRLYFCPGTCFSPVRYQAKLENRNHQAILNLRLGEMEVIHFKDGPVTDDDAFLTDLGITHLVLAPIRASRKSIGQIALARSEASHPFLPGDSLWINAVASNVGMVFERLLTKGS